MLQVRAVTQRSGARDRADGQAAGHIGTRRIREVSRNRMRIRPGPPADTSPMRPETRSRIRTRTAAGPRVSLAKTSRRGWYSRSRGRATSTQTPEGIEAPHDPPQSGNSRDSNHKHPDPHDPLSTCDAQSSRSAGSLASGHPSAGESGPQHSAPHISAPGSRAVRGCMRHNNPARTGEGDDYPASRGRRRAR